MKKCCACRQNKEREQFTKDIRTKDGLYSRCKECHLVFTNRYNHTRGGKRKKYIRRHLKKYQSEYRLRNRKKYLARKKFEYALSVGKITRKPCEICKEQKTDGHHEDYRKPLEVRWLCRTHHAKRHKEIGVVLPNP